MNVSETIRYRGAVSSANREGPQQRCETVADDTGLHNVRVDVDGIEPLMHVHHVLGLFTEKYGLSSFFFLGGKVTVADGVRPISARGSALLPSPTLGWVCTRVPLFLAGLLTSDGWNPKMLPIALR